MNEKDISLEDATISVDPTPNEYIKEGPDVFKKVKVVDTQAEKDALQTVISQLSSQIQNTQDSIKHCQQQANDLLASLPDLMSQLDQANADLASLVAVDPTVKP